MKVIAVAFAFLLAGVSAKPNLHANELESAIRSGETRIVTGQIIKVIEDLAQSIADAGLDPFITEDVDIDYALAVPSVFNARAHARGVESNGLSNIVVNRMNYAVLTSRLTFNIELPSIDLKIDSSAWDLNVLSGKFNGAVSGSVAVKSIVISGEIRINVGIISGISVRSINLNLDVNDIKSDLNVVLQGVNLSGLLNNYLGEKVPSAIKAHKNDINELLEIIALEIIEANL